MHKQGNSTNDIKYVFYLHINVILLPNVRIEVDVYLKNPKANNEK